MLYDSILPYLSIGNLGKYLQNYINCVYVLQKKVLRIVCNVDYQYHSIFKVLKLFDIIELKTA